MRPAIETHAFFGACVAVQNGGHLRQKAFGHIGRQPVPPPEGARLSNRRWLVVDISPRLVLVAQALPKRCSPRRTLRLKRFEQLRLWHSVADTQTLPAHSLERCQKLFHVIAPAGFVLLTFAAFGLLS